MSVSVSVSDLWRGMVSRKSHVSELKNWMPMHSNKKTKKTKAKCQLRAGGDPRRSKKPRWSTSDTGQWPQKRNAYASSFSQGSLAVRFFDLFKVSKMTILIMTCSKSAKRLFQL